jgi:hypothetical protein
VLLRSAVCTVACQSKVKAAFAWQQQVAASVYCQGMLQSGACMLGKCKACIARAQAVHSVPVTQTCAALRHLLLLFPAGQGPCAALTTSLYAGD